LSKLLVIIAGPTASGKTELAIRIAKHFKTVIISADSRQFFSELNIGTAKPDAQHLEAVKHYFINSHHISDNYNAGNFALECRQLIDKLFNNHDVIVIAGGSGLYIDAVLYGVDDLPEADSSIRNSLESLLIVKGITALQEKLSKLDPEYFEIIDRNNPRRLIRALEICMITGKKHAELLHRKNKKPYWPYIMAGIEWSREELYSRINKRVQKMISEGLIDEARNVIAYKNHQALQTVGYREAFEYIEGNLSLDETVELISKNTRNFAKRQMTWFRKHPEMIWIKEDETSKLVGLIQGQQQNLSDKESN
jgi:tRNA dimethylallyltransferase